MMERPIDFTRDRRMACPKCASEWVVTLDWIDRWDQAREKCPGCGATCEKEHAPRVTVDPSDPALRGDDVPLFFWYHTSTHANWPARTIDPAARLTTQTKLMMGGDAHVAAWAERQRSKALHVGTYEAAIHNMLRRLADQGDEGAQFYLYRVQLRPDVAVNNGWVIDPSDFVGDVALDEVCPPGVDVTRYLNFHEDPGGLSLALGRSAIASTQRLEIPVFDMVDEHWVETTTADLLNAPAVEPSALRLRFARRRPLPSPQVPRARQITRRLGKKLPISLREQFEAATVYVEGGLPERWARYTNALLQVVIQPESVLAQLDAQPHVTMTS